MGMKRQKKKKWLIWIVFLIIMITGIAAVGRILLSDELQVTFNHLYSPKILKGDTVRVVALADLHNREFGKENEELIKKVSELKPDIIVMAGDIADRREPDVSVAVNLCSRLKEIAPVYYGLGNQEGSLIFEQGINLDEQLRSVGVSVLAGTSEQLDVRGNLFSIGAVEAGDEESYKANAESFMKEYEKSTDFKLLISHIPQIYYEIMADAEIDLGICGHLHGGQFWVPHFGGLYSVDEGFFPKYCGGMYGITNGHIYVSRGLGNNTKIPRINNRPELTVIDINARSGN